MDEEKNHPDASFQTALGLETKKYPASDLGISLTVSEEAMEEN